MTVKRQSFRLAFTALLVLLCHPVAGAQGRVQYWVDNYAAARTAAVSGGTAQFSVDAGQLSQGLHVLYMRARATDGTYSPITSSPFIHLGAAGTGGGCRVEYWLDDDLTKAHSVPVNLEQGGEVHFAADLADYPQGLHRLSMRVTYGAGGGSPVYSTPVVVMPGGSNSCITYWLDDDYAGRQTIGAIHVTESVSQFMALLNLSAANEGMHHLKMSVATESGIVSAVYDYPILITRRYNSANSNVTIVQESRWWDDETPTNGSLSGGVCIAPGVYTASYVLDPVNYAPGQQHKFNVQYMNSEQVWSTPNVTYFYKDATGCLVPGLMPEVSGIDDTTAGEEQWQCTASGGGTVTVHCLSPRLGATATLVAIDIAGRVIARQELPAEGGIHTTLDVASHTGHMVIIRLMSGSAAFTTRLVVR